MKLKTIELKNFRCFESLTLEFHKQLTVIVGRNGTGKTSILDAIRIGLWSYVSGFDLAKTKDDSVNNINIDDIRVKKSKYNEMLKELPCEVILTPYDTTFFKVSNDIFSIIEDNYCWKHYRDSESSVSKIKSDDKAKYLSNFVKSNLQERIRNEIDTDLLVIAYYGIARFAKSKDLASLNKKSDDSFKQRLYTYRDCLNPFTSYDGFINWFRWIYECFENEKDENQKKMYETWIIVIQNAINKVLKNTTGWSNLQYSIPDDRSLIIHHEIKGKLKIQQLSDGIRGMLAIVSDIAYRCIKLNPHLGVNATDKANGIVIVDEIEIQLFPEWEQNILPSLVSSFPNIQFIVTTHSPQVLSTVASHQIRVLDEGKVHYAEAGTQGAEASRILRDIFDVKLRPQHLEIVKKLNTYLKLIDDDKWDSEDALKLRQELDEWSQGNEPELFKADINIRMKEYQRQL